MCWGQSHSGEHAVAKLLFPVTASPTLSLVNLQPLPHHDSLFFLGKSLVTCFFVSQMWEPGNCSRDCFRVSQLYTRFSFTINILAALWLCVRYSVLYTCHLHCFWLAVRSNIPNRKHHSWRYPLLCLMLKRLVIMYLVPIAPQKTEILRASFLYLLDLWHMYLWFP